MYFGQYLRDLCVPLRTFMVVLQVRLQFPALRFAIFLRMTIVPGMRGCLAPRRLDVGRRGRAADVPGPRAL